MAGLLIVNSTHLCHHLHALEIPANGTKCDSFTRPQILSERFTSSSTYQFYTTITDESQLGSALVHLLCGARLAGTAPAHSANPQTSHLCSILDGAALPGHMDFDFDAISHTVTITAFDVHGANQSPEASMKGTESITRPQDVQLELGVMQQETATDPEELSLGGFYMNVDGDDHPRKTIAEWAFTVLKTTDRV